MDLKTIGNAIRHRRKSLKVTQYDLAEIAEVSQRTLRDIEKGIANPELQTLLNVCTTLGMEIKIEVIKTMK
jgi:y4mF family transcriptional regulator